MRLLLIDGHYYAYRSFYAIRNLSNSKGEATNAVYGFVKTLRKMLVDLKPDLAAVVLDGGLSEKRLELQPEYKAQRDEMPDLLTQQMPIIETVIPILGFPLIQVAGEEADDLIACYVEKAKEMEDLEVILATNDKDLMQMVNGKVKIYQTKNATFQLLGTDEVTQKWGVPPDKIGDILALTGDAVDNIPGVPGIGPKTATGLIRQFGSIDHLLENLNQIKNNKVRENINQSRSQILSNRSMVELNCKLDLPVPLSDLKVEPNFPGMLEIFERLEFRTLHAEIKKLTETAPTSAQGDLFV
jgi:5'-3' exonuclease